MAIFLEPLELFVLGGLHLKSLGNFRNFVRRCLTFFRLSILLFYVLILLHLSQLLLHANVFDDHFVISLKIDSNHHLALVHNLNGSFRVENVLAGLDEVPLFLLKDLAAIPDHKFFLFFN